MYCLLNQNLTPIEMIGITPNTTVLQWLRQDLHLVGSKEGCAAGDCGACTVVVGELNDDGGVEYKSINSCIALACSLSGKHLVTVEGLMENDKLHPVQQAMVDEHGSQCGFCTPGFVMSLFALYQNETEVNLEKVQQALSGNLCRCTGYQPIINAAFVAFTNKQDDFYVNHHSTIVNVLNELQMANTLLDFNYDDGQNQQRYLCPKTVDDLAKLLIKYPDARIVAGSTDLGLEITQQFTTLPCVINIKEIKALQRIDEDDEKITLYAAISYEQAWDVLVRNYPTMDEFLTRFASKPIRNWATICGNVANASPIGDMPPVLIALDAVVSLRCGGQVRSMALEDFFLDYRQTALKPAEFIEFVYFAKLKPTEQLLTYKLSKRFEDDISAVCLALNVSFDGDTLLDVRAAFGGMAAIPKRAKKLEQTLMQHWHSKDLFANVHSAINAEFSPISDMRASKEYRFESAVKLVQKAHAHLINKPLPSVFQAAVTVGND